MSAETTLTETRDGAAIGTARTAMECVEALHPAAVLAPLVVVAALAVTPEVNQGR